jgi:N-acetylglucosamine-6-phosphate deacetylase
VAPELPGAETIIKQFAAQGTQVSLGHSTATYEQGLRALEWGATGLTHVMNCMTPLHQRNPGLAGLTSLPRNSTIKQPYYSLLGDGVHLHTNVASMLFKANPTHVMLISDSLELTGLPDGIYPGNKQVKHRQQKVGSKVVIEGTDTLVGSSVSVDECMRNLMEWTGCSVAESVRTVTENIADFMGLKDRGKLEEGRRADFCVMDDNGRITQTWIAGVKVWEE